jgi:RNA polymerase sigma factor (sigma-70 family)
MGGTWTAQTSPTLLMRLRQDPTDQAGWVQFVALYGPKIYGWCRKWGLNGPEAEDVAQDVLVRLAVAMKAFQYDPSRSFRGWLRTLTRHAWSEFLSGRRRGARGSGDPATQAMLETLEARDDLARRIEEAFDRELFEMASARVRLRVAPRTWGAFRLTALEGLSGAAAARTGWNP